MTRILFDTSVLVAGLVTPHPDHPRAVPWITAARETRFSGSVSTHALAEVWAVLTRLPIDPPISPPAATLAVERLLSFLEPFELPLATYRTAMVRCTDRGARSGAVYDAIHLVAAEHCGADVLLTFNARDFNRLVLPGSPRIVVPPEPPRVYWEAEP